MNSLPLIFLRVVKVNTIFRNDIITIPQGCKMLTSRDKDSCLPFKLAYATGWEISLRIQVGKKN